MRKYYLAIGLLLMLTCLSCTRYRQDQDYLRWNEVEDTWEFSNDREHLRWNAVDDEWYFDEPWDRLRWNEEEYQWEFAK